MISSILTPVRFYNDIYESDRFSSDCDILRFELISDKTRLLPFQIRRPKSPYPINKWILRKECVDPFINLLNSNDSLFTYDTGFWTSGNWQFVNGKLISLGTTACNLSKTGILTINKWYTIKIEVNEFYKQVASLYNISIDYTTTQTLTINGTGTYVVTFKADTTNFLLETPLTTLNDYSIIESIEIKEFKAFDASIGDVNLPISELSLINIDNDSDLIQYYGNEFDFQIPCGKYYMAITYGDESILYSELITVKDFIPSQSPYTMLEWTNTCDLSDVFYQEINGVQYFNRLYIEGELGKPEYPYKEEGEEDGTFKLNVLFQKWEKKQSLIVAKCPEFIVDALTTIRLHDTVTITKSIRKKQLSVLPAFEIDSMEPVVSSVFNDCATNVELKILLKDKIIDNTCCSNIEITPCFECKYSVTDFDELTGNYYFGNPTEDSDFGFYELIEGDYVLIQQENDVVCITSTDKKYININNEYWSEVPLIGNVVDTDLGSGNHSYNVTGYIYPGTYAKISVVIFNEALGITITDNLTNIYNDTQLSGLGINVLSSLFSVPVPANGTVKFYINNYSLNCNYGASPLYEFIYPELHPIVKSWYDSIDVKTDYNTTKKINDFIQGLDDDGFIEEFDLLHILAGLQTDDQRLKPLISTSGNNFQLAGGYVFDNGGFKGNGTSGYMNLKWKSASDGVKHLQADSSFGFYSNTAILEDSCDMGYFDGVVRSSIYSKKVSGNAEAAINNPVLFSGINPYDSKELFIIGCSGTTSDFYRNTINTMSDVGPNGTPPDVDYYLGAQNQFGSAGAFSTRQFQLVFIGGWNISDPINILKLKNRFSTLKSALGF